MEAVLHLLLLLPLTGFLVSLGVPARREKVLSQVAFWTVGLNLLTAVAFVVFWAIRQSPALDLRDVSIYRSAQFDFFLDFYFDRVSAFYLLTGSFITYLVTIYSRYYMHKESGYKRFFNTILFFYTGFNLTILAGNFETLFIGWEILGLSSFLLIAFYRTRYLPVRNALKVFTIYRIGDVGILLAMWMSHHLWHENVTFLKLHNAELVHEHLQTQHSTGIYISLLILMAAVAKSAQLPFSTWLPRAMEGPTPSSAIFYGSLSVHIGAFLLMRTFPFWEHQTSIRWVIAVLGFLTAAVTSNIARVQSTIKGQVAYSSSAQIGIIFMEIAAGFEILALIHFAGNALLRTYQLLISPSVVTYMIREQFYSFVPVRKVVKSGPLQRIRQAFYLLSLKEFKLESLVFLLFFFPLKKLRAILDFLNFRNLLWFFIPLYLLGFGFAYFETGLTLDFRNDLAVLTSFIALLMVARAYNEKSNKRLAWLLIVMAHFFIDLAVTFNDHFDEKEALVYLGGVIISGMLGYYCLYSVRNLEERRIGLNEFNGLVVRYRWYGFVFLLACLGLAGFPITSTFFGEDLILTHIHQNQILLAFFTAITFIVNGIAVIRIYSRVFLGQQTRSFLHKTDITA
ncbi:MAG: hypothetical protein H6581_26175 [Bacteroidia bacterium]|nr:hypothetical protein [Bacteroidia bacterium]